MKTKVVLVVALLVVTALPTASPIFADETPYQKAEQTYLSRLDTYRSEQTNFQTARQKYLDYNTLTSETTAINAGRSFQEATIDLVTGYLDLIIEKTNETTSISSNDKEYLVNFYRAEKSYYDSKRKEVSSAVAKEELKALGDDLNNHLASETKTRLPIIRAIIASNEYRSYLDQTAIIFEDTKKFIADQGFLSKATADLIENWVGDTNDKLRQSNETMKEITLNIRSYKEDGGASNEKQIRLNKANNDLSNLWGNLISLTTNLSEILGRLRNG